MYVEYEYLYQFASGMQSGSDFSKDRGFREFEGHVPDLFRKIKYRNTVSAKYCYAAHESRLHQNDRCKRFTLCLVLTVRFRSLAPWGKLFQLFI